jgi:hypothetical protein
LSVSIAYGVTSVPVPAVVGIATKGSDFKFGTENNCSAVYSGLLISIPIAFAASIGEPPPTPKIKKKLKE